MECCRELVMSRGNRVLFLISSIVRRQWGWGLYHKDFLADIVGMGVTREERESDESKSHMRRQLDLLRR